MAPSDEFIKRLRQEEGIPKIKDVQVAWVMTKHLDRMSAHCVFPESMILSIRFLEYFLKHYWKKDPLYPKQKKILDAKLKEDLFKARGQKGTNKKMDLEARYKYHMEVFSYLIEVMDRHNLLGQKETFDVIADYDEEAEEAKAAAAEASKEVFEE